MTPDLLALGGLIVGGTWRWTSSWPSTGDARLMRGGAA